MKLTQFINELKELGADWYLDKQGSITERSNEDCPVWAVYNESDDAYRLNVESPEDVFEAGERLGLTEHQVEQIIDAADNRQPFDVKIRKRLLEALKPTEEPHA